MTAQALPDGVEVNIVIYLTSPSSCVDVAVKLSGFAHVPDFAALDGKPALPAFVNIDDWRRMTREEIEAYKAEAREEDQ